MVDPAVIVISSKLKPVISEVMFCVWGAGTDVSVGGTGVGIGGICVGGGGTGVGGGFTGAEVGVAAAMVAVGCAVGAEGSGVGSEGVWVEVGGIDVEVGRDTTVGCTCAGGDVGSAVSGATVGGEVGATAGGEVGPGCGDAEPLHASNMKPIAAAPIVKICLRVNVISGCHSKRWFVCKNSSMPKMRLKGSSVQKSGANPGF